MFRAFALSVGLALATGAGAATFLNSFWMAAGALEGAFGYRTSADWDTELYDIGAWHSTGTNPTRFTLPANALVRLISSGTAAPSITRDTKGGAAFAGRASSFENITTSERSRASAIVSASATNYFEMPSSGTTADTRWASIEAIAAATKYVHLTKTSAQSIQAAADVVWATEVADVGGWFDSGTSTVNVVVPSGTTLVRVSANAEFDTADNTGHCAINPLKNSASAVGLPYFRSDRVITNRAAFNVFGAPIEVTAGDTLKLSSNCLLSNDMTANDGTWLTVEEVPATYKRALAYKSATQDYTSGVEASALLGSEAYDTDAIHDTSSNTDRMTVPASCNGGYARIAGNVIVPSSVGQITVRFTKNDASFRGTTSSSVSTSTTDLMNIFTGWVPVSTGDYFKMLLLTNANLTVSTDVRTWLSLECRAA